MRQWLGASSCQSFLNSLFFPLILSPNPPSPFIDPLLIWNSSGRQQRPAVTSSCSFLILMPFHLSHLMLWTFSIVKCFSLDFSRTSLMGCFLPLLLLLNIFCFGPQSFMFWLSAFLCIIIGGHLFLWVRLSSSSFFLPIRVPYNAMILFLKSFTGTARVHVCIRDGLRGRQGWNCQASCTLVQSWSEQVLILVHLISLSRVREVLCWHKNNLATSLA